MAQSGFTPIQVYRSTTPGAVPLAANLAPGELALNTADERLFFENASGTVVSISRIVSLTTQVTGTLPVANGGTGVTVSTGSGSNVLSTSPVLVTPTLGAATATSLTTGVGSAGAPTFTFAGRTTTGIYSPAADSIAFSEGGIECMRIAAGGNVGIRTTSPGTALDVAAVAVSGNAIRVRANATSTVGVLQFTNSTGVTQTGLLSVTDAGTATLEAFGASSAIAFRTNAAERFRINNLGGITSSNAADAVGYKGLPQIDAAISYTLVLTDMGKMIYLNGTTAGQSVTIPPNSGGGSVAFPAGTQLRVLNDSTQSWTIQTTDTLIWSPTGGTGTRTLAAGGSATLEKVAATRWWISGVGLT
jgi:hypothetical protein